MSQRDDDRPAEPRADAEPSEDRVRAEPRAELNEDRARAVDAAVRALRDEPVASETLARMRAGLAERIAAHDGAAPAPTGDGGSVSSIETHARWWTRPALAAAALAAAILLLLVARGDRDERGAEPTGIAADEAPASGGSALASGEEAARPPAGSDPTPSSERVAGRAEQAPTERDPTARSSEPAIARHGGADAESHEPAIELDSASEEELAVALEYDRLTDFDVIAQLELLEALDELEAEGRI